MNISIICDVLGEENNGTTIAAMNLIRSLQNKGHNLKILCCNKNKINDPSYFIVKERNILFLNPIVHRNGVHLAALNKKRVIECIKDADHVHLLLPFKISSFAAKYCQKHNIPISASFHCQAENFTSHLGLKNCNILSNVLYRYYYRRVFKYANIIHYPTQFIRDVFESVVGKTNGVVISNGVNDIYKKIDVEKPSDLKNKFVILNIGRLCSEKNQKVLIKAISISKYKNDIKLILAGDGPDKKKLLKLANKKKVDAQINFFSREELSLAINTADLYCHPAEMEIESISCIEALSCGLVPIISDSRKSATRFFALDNRCLFKNNNAEDLANKIDYFIEHPQEKELLSKEYLNNNFKFNQQHCMDQMEQMIISCAIKDGVKIK